MSKDRFSCAIKYLRDRKQIVAIRLRNNQVSYFKTGNELKRMRNSRGPSKTCDLIFPDRKLNPMEFTVHLLSQSQFSEGRHELF